MSRQDFEQPIDSQVQRDTLQAYARGSLDLIQSNIDLYRHGLQPVYRVIAVELRLLLCDSNRAHNRLVDISLLPRIIPDLRLQPIKKDAQTENAFMFDRSAPALPLKEWLTQVLPGSDGLTIKNLILGVCEQDGGAHVDPHPTSPIWEYSQRAQAIICIGEYLLDLGL